MLSSKSKWSERDLGRERFRERERESVSERRKNSKARRECPVFILFVLRPTYTEVAHAMSGFDDVVVARMDLTANDLPIDLEVSSICSFLLLLYASLRSAKKTVGVFDYQRAH